MWDWAVSFSRVYSLILPVKKENLPINSQPIHTKKTPQKPETNKTQQKTKPPNPVSFSLFVIIICDVEIQACTIFLFVL